MDQQLIRFVEPLLRNALTQCIAVFGLKNWELYTDNDFNGTDFALLGAADMKLFAKLSCQGSICILCKWIEQLMLTSLNKTKIQIWKPYSSRSVSLFFLSSHSPPVHSYPSHKSTRLDFFIVPHTFVRVHNLSHTLSCWEAPNVYVPSVFFSSDPGEPPAEWLLTSHLLLPVTEFEKWA